MKTRPVGAEFSMRTKWADGRTGRHLEDTSRFTQFFENAQTVANILLTFRYKGQLIPQTPAAD
jgi:hypothetical protein